jgi:hypothetical protein
MQTTAVCVYEFHGFTFIYLAAIAHGGEYYKVRPSNIAASGLDLQSRHASRADVIYSDAFV